MINKSWPPFEGAETHTNGNALTGYSLSNGQMFAYTQRKIGEPLVLAQVEMWGKIGASLSLTYRTRWERLEAFLQIYGGQVIRAFEINMKLS